MKGINLKGRDELDRYIDIITRSLSELPTQIILTDEAYDRITGFDSKETNLAIIPVYRHPLKRFKILSSFQYIARKLKNVKGN